MNSRFRAPVFDAPEAGFDDLDTVRERLDVLREEYAVLTEESKATAYASRAQAKAMIVYAQAVAGVYDPPAEEPARPPAWLNFDDDDFDDDFDDFEDWAAGGVTSTPVPEPSHLETDDGTLRVRCVDFRLSDGERLLCGVDLNAAPGTLTAIIGPSGAGKTTLSRLLTGQTQPSAGQVILDGFDLHTNYSALRSRIGFVPQDNVVHHQLTTRQALGYAARLRLPPGTTKAEYDARCAAVMDELGLTERADVRVGKLSGGQRKRVSVAIELLTSPTMLVLDEPTTGLDPALDKQVMELLRHLAEDGRIVIIVTHSLDYLKLTDQVLLLGPGGRPVYLGPPDGIEPAFGTEDWADIFQRVADKPKGLWHRYLQRAGMSADDIAVLDKDGSEWLVNRWKTPSLPRASISAGIRRSVRQGLTLIRRQIRLVFADLGYAVFLLLLPIVSGALALIVPGDTGFGKPGPPDAAGMPSTEPAQLLMLLVFAACFMGAGLTFRDLISERQIFLRERSAGVAPSSYLVSKLMVFGVFAIVQAIMLVTVVLLVKPRPGAGVLLKSGSTELVIDIAAASICSMCFGLLLSALARSSDQVTPLLVVFAMAQLVLSGGWVPVTARDGLQQFAAIWPSRWGFAAGASTIDLRGLLGDLVQKDNLWNHTSMHWWLNIGVLAGMAVVVSLVTFFQLRLHNVAPRRRRRAKGGLEVGVSVRPSGRRRGRRMAGLSGPGRRPIRAQPTAARTAGEARRGRSQ